MITNMQFKKYLVKKYTTYYSWKCLKTNRRRKAIISWHFSNKLLEKYCINIPSEIPHIDWIVWWNNFSYHKLKCNSEVIYSNVTEGAPTKLCCTSKYSLFDMMLVSWKNLNPILKGVYSADSYSPEIGFI